LAPADAAATISEDDAPENKLVLIAGISYLRIFLLRKRKQKTNTSERNHNILVVSHRANNEHNDAGP
jgi:D-Tyr-tRNAtyr deacylase